MAMTRTTWVWGSAVLLVLAFGLGVLLFRRPPLPLADPARLDGDATLRLLASDDFARLSPEQKLAFADRLKALRPGGPS